MGNPLQYSCLKNPMDRGAWLQSGCNPWGCKESDTTEGACTHIKGILKDTDEQSDEEINEGRFRNAEALSAGVCPCGVVELWGWGTLPFLCMDVFTDPEALWTPPLRSFYGGLIMQL